MITINEIKNHFRCLCGIRYVSSLPLYFIKWSDAFGLEVITAANHNFLHVRQNLWLLDSKQYSTHCQSRSKSWKKLCWDNPLDIAPSLSCFYEVAYQICLIDLFLIIMFSRLYHQKIIHACVLIPKFCKEFDIEFFRLTSHDIRYYIYQCILIFVTKLHKSLRPTLKEY